jgi:hypothetical protein
MENKKDKKNIAPFLSDIRRPSQSEEKGEKSVPDFLTKADDKFKLNIKPSFFGKFKKYLIILFAALAILFLFSTVIFQKIFFYSTGEFSRRISENADALTSEGRAAASSPAKQTSKLEDIGDFLKIFGSFKSVLPIFSAVKNLNQESIHLALSMAEIKMNGFPWLFDDGEKLLGKLKELSQSLRLINNETADIRNQLAKLDVTEAIPLSYLESQTQLYASGDFLEAIIDFLGKNSRLVFLFENASEIRPAGGFIGSYADVNIEKGQIKRIDVSDINAVDKLWNSKVIPPKPLQLIAESWEARDANWFFDFPTSARKVIYFLEKSPLYAKQGVKFEAAIAMNHRAVEDIFKIIGDVELPAYKLVLNQDNFLYEIQKEVSTDSWLRGSERKQILKELAPKIIEALKNLSEEKKNELFRLFGERIKNKDVRFYFTNPKIQNFLANFGAAGEIYSLPKNFFGDYLAVVNANVNGGKTDVFMEQSIVLKSKIDAYGNFQNKLYITRKHTGQNQKLSFYRSVNQDFLRILTPRGSKIVSVKGNSSKTVIPPLNYSKAGYERDSDVEALEKGEEAGKTVFGYWLNVRPGKTGALELTYERPGIIGDKRFQFIYEKQSGVETSLEYEFEAPLGYVFAESGKSMFSYKRSSVPGRLILNLTLQKL